MSRWHLYFEYHDTKYTSLPIALNRVLVILEILKNVSKIIILKIYFFHNIYVGVLYNKKQLRNNIVLWES